MATRRRSRVADQGLSRGRPNHGQLQHVQKQIGYKFKNERILRVAFEDPSTGNEANNSRLAWEGEALLGLCFSTQCFENMPRHSVEVLNSVRDQLMNEKRLAAAADKVDASQYYVYKRDAAPQGVTTQMKALLWEAIMGALWVDTYYDYKIAYDVHNKVCPFVPPGALPDETEADVGDYEDVPEADDDEGDDDET